MINNFREKLKEFRNRLIDQERERETQTEDENYVIFHDGDICKLVSKRIIYEENKAKYHEFELLPTSVGFLRKNNVRDSEKDPTTGIYTKRFPLENCVLLNDDPMNTRWKIDCLWNGDPVSVNDLVIDRLRKEIRLLRETIKTKDIDIAELKRDEKRAAEEKDYQFERAYKQLKKYKELDSEAEDKKSQFPMPTGFGPMADLGE